MTEKLSPQFYLVGGAVRDELLGRPITEKDWVVVGATVDYMLEHGFKQVGKDFPVFLHPESNEEYALARTERKKGRGYTGFEVIADLTITLEQDLLRRDLTINAMAKDQNGNIIDPYNGQNDLQQKILRHVSNAFVEDPLRILRVARFYARYYELGFTIAPETMDLMKKMVKEGDVDALTPERIWQELVRALGENHPEKFIEVLYQCGALKILFPEVYALFGIPNPEQWHPEIDTGIHTLMALQQAAILSPDAKIRFAVLMHDVGKVATPKEKLPSHPGHEDAGVTIIKNFAKRLRIPTDFADLAIIVSRHHIHCHQAKELRSTSILNLFETTDAFRKPQRFEAFLIACEADARGRKGFENRSYEQADFLRNIFKEIKNIKLDESEMQDKTGEQIKESLRQKRLSAVKEVRKKLLIE